VEIVRQHLQESAAVGTETSASPGAAAREAVMISTAPRQAALVQRPTGSQDVILIEDNPHDAKLLRLALAEAGIRAQLHVAAEPVRAFELLAGLTTPPALVILDLNLPLIAGAAILGDIRVSRRWAEVPVVVLTSSLLERDIDACIELGANGYKLKPASFEGYHALARYEATFLVGAAGADRRDPPR
jgi:two-component system response regulator